MSGIVIFGAGGRAGRAVTAEARARGHQLTAVVRDPGKYRDLDVPTVRGDVTDGPGVLTPPAAAGGGRPPDRPL
jgi:putative NADH-flavin reductase